MDALEFAKLLVAIAFLGLILRWAIYGSIRKLLDEQEKKEQDCNHQEP